MNRIIFAITCIALCTCIWAQENGNYIVVINNDSIQTNDDNEVLYTTPGGETLNIKVTQPNILTYSDDMISFNHAKTLSVSNTIIDEGIEQCMAIRPTGNGFLVQKYSTIDPSSLTRLMLNEITKESISYGYTKTEETFTKKLTSGQTIEGVKATLEYKEEVEIFTVATYGGRDEGIIVVTMLLNDDFEEQGAIDLFLNTLKIR
jgi:hypothetical protein